MIIESLQNEKIKNLNRLITDNRFRKKSGVFVVEGKQENERALQFGFENVEFFYLRIFFWH
jgi:TrmH family RNA methyltransferase